LIQASQLIQASAVVPQASREMNHYLEYNPSGGRRHWAHIGLSAIGGRQGIEGKFKAVSIQRILMVWEFCLDGRKIMRTVLATRSRGPQVYGHRGKQEYGDKIHLSGFHKMTMDIYLKERMDIPESRRLLSFRQFGAPRQLHGVPC